jgi:phosphatidylethanolamine/phosphatidyl-N-methylethanolamine N-methyltransferase
MRKNTLINDNTQFSDLIAQAQGPWLLLRRSLRNPLQICSVFPSSPFVGRAMTQAIANRPAPRVIELGAGTGAVTRQLIRNGVTASDLTLIEIDAQLGRHLRCTFPEVDVIVAPAQEAAKIWRERNGPPVGAVVSTLPMRLFSKPLIRSVMRSALETLAPGGLFVQFTYRLGSPAPIRIVNRLGLTAERYRHVWANFPPAAIWVYQKPFATQTKQDGLQRLAAAGN